MKKKKFLSAVVIILFIAGSLYLLQRLVMPKYMDNVVEGNFIAEYYDEE